MIDLAEAPTPDVAVSVDDLEVSLTSGATIVEHVSFRIPRGRVLALVGESGCGKTTTAQALLGAVRPGAIVTGGAIVVGGTHVHGLKGRALRRYRGRQASYVPQDPGASLSPSMRIGDQIEEMLVHHLPDETEKRALVRRYLELVQLPITDEFLRRFPHQLSGGQQQRVLIAMALICRPTVVVLDEPTTGLDVTTQARVLETIDSLRREFDLALLYVTHNLGVVARFADEVAVMYGGRIVEHAGSEQIFRAPAHPYTRRLIAAMPRSDVSRYQPQGIPGAAVAPSARPAGCPFEPRCEFRSDRCTEAFPPVERVVLGHSVHCFHWREAVTSDLRVTKHAPGIRADIRLEVTGLNASYGQNPVLHDLGFELHAGETLAVVGESGSGKSTLARCILGIVSPTAGRIVLDGRELARTARQRSAEERRRIQIIFQNPDSSLNPRQTVREIVGRPAQLFLKASRRELRAKVDEALELVRLDTSLAGRKPSALSGGEKQRVAIARAIAAKPELLVCDEVTSALDVSVQAAIVQLLDDLRRQLEMSLIFVSHDLAVVRSVADQVLVLEHGLVHELAPVDDVFERPKAGYTRELLGAHRAWSLEAITEEPSDIPASVLE